MAENSENRYNLVIMIDNNSQDDREQREAAEKAHQETVRRMAMTTGDKLSELYAKVRELESRVERLENSQK